MAGTKKTRALELAKTEARLEGIPKGGSRRTGISEGEKVALEVLLSTIPMAAALKTVSAVKKFLKPASKTIRKRAKADKVRKKDKDKRMAARKREREGMSDHEKIKLGLLAVGGGTYAALRTAFPDPLSMGERNKRRAEKEKENTLGGYIKKYASGGGVRKVRT